MKKILYTLFAVAVAMTSTSCDNNAEPAPWQPADECTAPGIFFTNTDNIMSITVGGDTHVSIPVRRTDATDELTVPLVVTAGHPDLQVPSELTFAAGQQDAEIIVDLANIPTKQPISLYITFPEEYVNPYVAGPTSFDGSVLVSDWESVADGPVQVQWFDLSFNPTNIIDPIDQELMNLPGTNRYKILNFLNSGYDFMFELEPSTYPAWTGYNRIIPLGNQVLYSEYSWAGYYNPWWFVSDDLTEWPVLELTSNSKPITLYAPSFMWYDDDYGNEYCYMRLAGSTDANGNVANKNFLYMAFYGFYGEDWDWSNFTGYLEMYIEFPAK